MAIMHYVEHFDLWGGQDVGATAEWTPYNVTINHGIPPSAILELNLRNTYNVQSFFVGVRSTASSGEPSTFRKIRIDAAIIGGTNVVMHVQLDSSGYIECYTDSIVTDRVQYEILGYWVGGIYTDAYELFGPSVPDVWEGYALDAHGVASGQIAEIMISNDTSATSRIAGVRTSGSVLDRRFELKDERNAGEECLSLFVYPSGSNAAIEIWGQDLSSINFHLIGYFSTPPGDYNEDKIVFPTPGEQLIWVGLDIGASGVPSSVLGQFVTQVNRLTQGTMVGLRKDGSSLERIIELDRRNTDEVGPATCTMHSHISSSGTLEYYTSNTEHVPLYSLAGYWDNFQDSPSPFTHVQEVDLFVEGSNEFIHYVETDSTTFDLSSANSWISTTIPTSLNIPVSTDSSPIVVELLMLNSSVSLGRTAGARSVGSNLDRKFLLRRNPGNGLDALTILVPVDSSGNIELYASATFFVDFVVLGYWRGGFYTESFDQLSASSAGSWVDLDLGSEYANSVVEIVIRNNSAEFIRIGGVRSVGSSSQRLFNLAFDVTSGHDFVSLHVNTNSDGTIEVYSSNLASVTFYLVGKWDTPPGTYTELMATATTATATNVWQIKDINIAQGSIAEIIIEHRDKDSDLILGVRERGSQFAKKWSLSQTSASADGDSSAMLRSSVNMTDGTDIEVLHNFFGASHVFTKVGSWASINRIPIITNGSATLFMSGKPAEISTSGDLGGLYPSGVSMFIHGVVKAPVDMFIEGAVSMSGEFDLLIFGVNIFKTDTEFSAQYPSGVALVIEGRGILPASGQIDVIIRGRDSISSSGDMFTEGFDFASNSNNLFLKTPEPENSQITLYLHNIIDPGPGLIRELNAVFYLSRRKHIDSPATKERLQDIDWWVSQVLFDNKPLLDQAGAIITAGDNSIPIYNDMGGSFSSSANGFALVGNVPDQQNLMGHIVSPADYIYAGSGSIMAAFWMSGANTSGNIVDVGWFNRGGSFSSLGDSENDHTVGIRITSGNKIQVRTSVRDLPYDLPTSTGLWWGGTTHYGTPTGSSWTWRTPDEYWAWNEEWPEVDIDRNDIAFFMIRSDFVVSGAISGLPAHVNVSLSVDGNPWVSIGSGITGPPASSLFSASEPTNVHAENAVGVMVQAVNADGGDESLLVNEIVLWTDSQTLSPGELSAFYGLAPNLFRPLDEYKPTADPTETYIRRTIGPINIDPEIPGTQFFGANVGPGLLVTLEVGLGDYGSDASAYLLEETPPSGFVIRNIKPHENVTYTLQGTRPTTQQQIFHDPQSGVMEPYDHDAGVNAYGASIRWVHHSNHPENDIRRTPIPTGIYTYELFPVSYNDFPPVENFTFDGSGLFFNGTNGQGVFSVQITGDTSGTVSGLNKGFPSDTFELYISGPTANSGSIHLYIRTEEKFTSAFIGSSDRTPEVTDFVFAADGEADIEFLPGIEYGPTLFTKGPLFLDGNCPLFTTGPVARDKTLYIHGIGTFSTSGAFPSGLEMIEQGHITVSGAPNLFTAGPMLVSGNTPFYIQAGGVGRIKLVEHGHVQHQGAISGFIKGPEFTTTSGNFIYPLDSTRFTFPSGGNSPDLYINGPEFIITSGDFSYPGDSTLFTTPSGSQSPDLTMVGAATITSSMTLFIGPIPAREQWTLYIKTGDNVATKQSNLFIHGFFVPSGVSGLNQAFNNTTMYIEADNVTIPYTGGGTEAWSMFMKSAASDPINRQSWSLYLKADTTTTGVCPLFTYAHAIGESPRGIVFSGSVGLVVSTDPDDPNRIGFIPHSSHDGPWTLFVKVDTGFFNTTNMYISGASPISAFASSNLFVRGLFEQKTAIATLYLMGVSGLFNNGPGGLHLFLEAGTLVYNTSGNLYTHGY